MHAGIANRGGGKNVLGNSRRMRNPQFYVSGERPKERARAVCLHVEYLPRESTLSNAYIQLRPNCVVLCFGTDRLYQYHSRYLNTGFIVRLSRCKWSHIENMDKEIIWDGESYCIPSITMHSKTYVYFLVIWCTLNRDSIYSSANLIHICCCLPETCSR